MTATNRSTFSASIAALPPNVQVELRRREDVTRAALERAVAVWFRINEHESFLKRWEGTNEWRSWTPLAAVAAGMLAYSAGGDWWHGIGAAAICGGLGYLAITALQRIRVRSELFHLKSSLSDCTFQWRAAGGGHEAFSECLDHAVREAGGTGTREYRTAADNKGESLEDEGERLYLRRIHRLALRAGGVDLPYPD